MVFFMLAPGIVYGATFIPRAQGDLWAPPWSDRSVAAQIVGQQTDMAAYHLELRMTSDPRRIHPYSSPPASWPSLARPVVFIFSVASDGFRQVLALGNPFAWWSGLLAMVALCVRCLKRSAERHGLVLIATAFGATYLFWFLTPPGPNVYLYYFGTAVPFLALATGWVASRVARFRWGMGSVVGYLAICLASLAFFYPVLTFKPLSAEGWRTRMRFRDCERAEFVPDVAFKYPPLYDDDLLPYKTSREGWCWI